MKKKEKLSDLNLRQEPSLEEMERLLGEHNLKIANSLQDRYSLFEALSFYVYRFKNNAQRIKDVCAEYVRKRVEEGSAPEGFEFICETPGFLALYCEM